MDDALVVGELQRLANLRHDGQRLLRRDLPRLQQLAQVHAVHEFHQQVIEPVRLAEVVDRDDVRVVQPGQRLGLARNRSANFGSASCLRRQDLQRHQPVQLGLAGLVNHAHAAAAEAFEDFELREVLWRFPQTRGQWPVDLRAVRTQLRPESPSGQQVQLHEAPRAEPFERVGGQWRAATGASLVSDSSRSSPVS